MMKREEEEKKPTGLTGLETGAEVAGVVSGIALGALTFLPTRLLLSLAISGLGDIGTDMVFSTIYKKLENKNDFLSRVMKRYIEGFMSSKSISIGLGMVGTGIKEIAKKKLMGLVSAGLGGELIAQEFDTGVAKLLIDKISQEKMNEKVKKMALEIKDRQELLDKLLDESFAEELEMDEEFNEMFVNSLLEDDFEMNPLLENLIKTKIYELED